MRCYTCRRYRWDDDLEIVYKDSSKKEYCAFHAPKDNKKLDEYEFEELIHKRIERSKQNGTPCIMTGTIFPHFITFQRYTQDNALPEIHFDHAIFEIETFFTHTHFSKHVSFEYTNFRRGALFNAAHLHNTTNFYKTDLYKSSFNNAIFAKKCSFMHTQFNQVSFTHTEFNNEVDFIYSIFNTKPSFVETEFSKKAYFSNCTINSLLEFSRIKTRRELVIEHIENIKFVTFTDTSLNNISFRNINWPRHPTDERYIISAEEIPDKMKSVADFYRQMKKRSREEQNDAEASLWHYAEKEVQLKILKDTKPRFNFTRLTLATYRLISRYGEDPWQALRVLGVLAAVLATAIVLGALWGKPFAFSDISQDRFNKFAFTFAQYALLDKPTYQIHPAFAAIALLFSRLLIPIQAAIFAFALRNKLHR